MSSVRILSGRFVAMILCWLALLHQVSALTISYCSSINTASTNANSSIYQSNGLCHDFCDSSYAFAVLQDSSCWCSNYVPASTVSVSNCDSGCPGYPSDLCGGQGLFGYIALDQAPSGTKGASSSKATSSQAVTVPTTPSAVTVVSTVQLSPSASSLSSSSSTSIDSGTTSSPTVTSAPSSSSSSSSLTWTPTPVTSVETVTGEVRTVTIIPTSPPSSSQSSSIEQTSKAGGLSTGQAVGLTVGLVALVAIVGVIIFCCVRRRRQQHAMFDNASGGNSTLNHSPQRTMSQNSSYMLRTDGRNVVEGWTNEEPEGNAGRGSRLLPVDPRLDPFAPVYQRGDGSRSHESIQTMHDNHDYSRRVHPQAHVLSVTNPD